MTIHKRQILQLRVKNINFFLIQIIAWTTKHQLTSTEHKYDELHCLFICYRYSEIIYNFKYQFYYLHAVQTKPCVNMESSQLCITRLWCASANRSAQTEKCVCFKMSQGLKQPQQAVGFILQEESRDPRPSAQLCLGHQRWACRASPGRDLLNICSLWVRSHLGWCHRTLCSAPNWLLLLSWQHLVEPGQTRHLHLQEWEIRGYL